MFILFGINQNTNYLMDWMVGPLSCLEMACRMFIEVIMVYSKTKYEHVEKMRIILGTWRKDELMVRRVKVGWERWFSRTFCV